MVDFALPPVYSNPDAWGPPPDGDNIEGFSPDVFNYAFEHLDKYPFSRQGARICDFTITGQKYLEQRIAKGKGKGKKGQPLAPGKDEDGLLLSTIVHFQIRPLAEAVAWARPRARARVFRLITKRASSDRTRNSH